MGRVFGTRAFGSRGLLGHEFHLSCCSCGASGSRIHGVLCSVNAGLSGLLDRLTRIQGDHLLRPIVIDFLDHLLSLPEGFQRRSFFLDILTFRFQPLEVYVHLFFTLTAS